MATAKQKAVAKKILENNGNVSKTMREVGYSESHSKNPHILTGSKGWKELIEEYMPDSLLAEKHNDLLNKKESFFGKFGIEMTDQPHPDVKGALDMAYKLKDKYANEKHEHSFKGLSDEELKERTAELIAGIVSSTGGAGQETD